MPSRVWISCHVRWEYIAKGGRCRFDDSVCQTHGSFRMYNRFRGRLDRAITGRYTRTSLLPTRCPRRRFGGGTPPIQHRLWVHAHKPQTQLPACPIRPKRFQQHSKHTRANFHRPGLQPSSSTGGQASTHTLPSYKRRVDNQVKSQTRCLATREARCGDMGLKTLSHHRSSLPHFGQMHTMPPLDPTETL